MIVENLALIALDKNTLSLVAERGQTKSQICQKCARLVLYFLQIYILGVSLTGSILIIYFLLSRSIDNNWFSIPLSVMLWAGYQFFSYIYFLQLTRFVAWIKDSTIRSRIKQLLYTTVFILKVLGFLFTLPIFSGIILQCLFLSTKGVPKTLFIMCMFLQVVSVTGGLIGSLLAIKSYTNELKYRY